MSACLMHTLYSPSITSYTQGTRTVAGKARPRRAVFVYVNGVAIGGVPVDASGNWSYALPSSVSSGAHTLTAVETVLEDQSTPSAALSVTV